MIHSVYNWKKGKFDYYEAPQKPWPISDYPKPRSGPLREIGAAPEEVAHKLPAGARYVGDGDEAKGLIAVGAMDDSDSIVDILKAHGFLLVMVGIGAYYFLKK